MAYGTLAVDTVQSSTAGTPTQFNDGNGVQVGTLCRAWVNFNGISGSVAIRSSFNVSSVTRNSTGDYTVTMTNALSDANYSYSVAIGFTSPADYMLTPLLNTATGYTEVVPTTTTFRFLSGLNYATGAYRDPKYVNVSVFR